jgi:hypothetical protein
MMRDTPTSLVLRSVRRQHAVRLGYTGGWRWGFVCGLVAGMVLAASVGALALQAGVAAGAL